MKPRRQFDTGADASRNDTALKRAEPGRSGRLRVRSLVVRGLAAVLLAAFAALLSLPPVAQAQTAVPGAPTALTATADGTTEIDLSWIRPGQRRRRRHQRLQDRGLHRRRHDLDQPRGRHRLHRHHLLPHRPLRRRSRATTASPPSTPPAPEPLPASPAPPPGPAVPDVLGPDTHRPRPSATASGSSSSPPRSATPSSYLHRRTTTPSSRTAPRRATPTSRPTATGSRWSAATPPPTPATTPKPPTRPPTRAFPSTGSTAPRSPINTRTSTTGPGTTRPTTRTSPATTARTPPCHPTGPSPAADTTAPRRSRPASPWPSATQWSVSASSSSTCSHGPLGSGIVSNSGDARPFYGLFPVFIIRDPVLVSNTGQTKTNSSINVGNTNKTHSQTFTTGPAGANLASVGVYVEDEDLGPGRHSLSSSTP